MNHLEELGKRAVACKHWKWMDGMLLVSGLRVGSYAMDGHGYAVDLKVNESDLPDLDDPATIGCIMHILEEIYGVGVFLHVDEDGYWMCIQMIDWAAEPISEGTSRAQVLRKALEAAP